MIVVSRMHHGEISVEDLGYEDKQSLPKVLVQALNRFIESQVS